MRDRFMLRTLHGKLSIALLALLLEVSDTGRGIAPEHLPFIFDRTYRVPAEAAGEETPHGAGLGLAITRRIVELHSGEITARRTPGAGSTFSFSLPLAAP